MILTPEKFVKTEFGFVVGVLFVLLAFFSLLRGSPSGKRSPTGVVVTLTFLAIGGYIVARFMGYDL